LTTPALDLALPTDDAAELAVAADNAPHAAEGAVSADDAHSAASPDDAHSAASPDDAHSAASPDDAYSAASPDDASDEADDEPDADAVTFADLGLPADLLDAISDLGFTIPTDIQAEAIPVLLSGRDVVGIAQTGTGKTAAFGLPLLAAVDPTRPRCRRWC